MRARLQGHTDIPLNARGRDQADSVGRLLRGGDLKIADFDFLSSPMARAVETMRRLRAAIGLAEDGFSQDDRLKELSFGAWEGFSLGEIRQRDPHGFRAREADKWDFRPPRGESYADLAARVAAVVDGLTRPTLIVAHGGVVRIMLSLYGGVDREATPGIAIPQGRALVFEGGGWRWI